MRQSWYFGLHAHSPSCPSSPLFEIVAHLNSNVYAWDTESFHFFSLSPLMLFGMHHQRCREKKRKSRSQSALFECLHFCDPEHTLASPSHHSLPPWCPAIKPTLTSCPVIISFWKTLRGRGRRYDERNRSSIILNLLVFAYTPVFESFYCLMFFRHSEKYI